MWLARKEETKNNNKKGSVKFCKNIQNLKETNIMYVKCWSNLSTKAAP
jgi:hypothetical protein